ncbi:hypothetical protein [Phenylobacterium sp.]|uniref:hypothetical protein n=1 Tax=Phenylobacterium sp. TaxID=1871053 RepID=UPI002E345DBD|nr:hypothetical protein [Phenylobacterium sp.]HEX2559132.1 hypothetical protein [Phenylobacterium sp.]
MTSSKNTADEPSAIETDFLNLEGDDPKANKKDAALEALQEQLEGEKDARSEERFVWIVLMVILLDIIWFRDSENPTLPVVVLVLELVALMVLARRMGVDDYVTLVGRILAQIGNKGGG